MGTECRREASPWVPGWGGPSDALGSVRVHACVWELFMLSRQFYYSYIHRNKNVARGGGREIQEGRDIRNLRVIQVDVWQKSSDTAQNYL